MYQDISCFIFQMIRPEWSRSVLITRNIDTNIIALNEPYHGFIIVSHSRRLLWMSFIFCPLPCNVSSSMCCRRQWTLWRPVDGVEPLWLASATGLSRRLYLTSRISKGNRSNQTRRVPPGHAACRPDSPCAARTRCVLVDTLRAVWSPRNSARCAPQWRRRVFVDILPEVHGYCHY